jgi:hypothetical protein
MTPNIPWRTSIVPFPDEAIASIVTRLAPEGLTSVKNFKRNHLNLPYISVGSIGGQPEVWKELAIVGSFDISDLERRAWSRRGDKTFFLGRALPVGWFDQERRRIAPSVLLSDGADPWIRNSWLIRAFTCDPTSGETILDRCPECHVQLGWVNLEHVWQCDKCGFDLRMTKPTYGSAKELSVIRELADFFQGNRLPLPDVFANLADIDLLKLLGWFAYFCGLPDQMLLSPSAANAVDGYRALKGWPHTFDSVVKDLITGLAQASGTSDLLIRTQLMMRFTASIDRLTTDAGRVLIRNRLAELFQVPKDHVSCYKKFFEPVMNFSGSIKRYEWPAPPTIDVMRSNHERARLIPRASKT